MSNRGPRPPDLPFVNTADLVGTLGGGWWGANLTWWRTCGLQWGWGWGLSPEPAGLGFRTQFSPHCGAPSLLEPHVHSAKEMEPRKLRPPHPPRGGLAQGDSQESKLVFRTDLQPHTNPVLACQAPAHTLRLQGPRERRPRALCWAPVTSEQMGNVQVPELSHRQYG